jgi:hypothetical protein
MYPSKACSDDADPGLHSLPEHQRAAVASPHTPLSDLVGNFSDLESLFDRLGEPNLIELGKPLPRKKFLPKKRVGSSPAAHNEALLDKTRSASA